MPEQERHGPPGIHANQGSCITLSNHETLLAKSAAFGPTAALDCFPVWKPPMLLSSQPLPPVPDNTARIAQAAFRRGNLCVLLRDRLGAVFADADLYLKLGQPAYAPWHLALITLMQFHEGLSDRQAADAVRGRIDWEYVPALDLADAGFDFSTLREFRARLPQHGATGHLLARLLDAARKDGLVTRPEARAARTARSAGRRAPLEPAGTGGRDVAVGFAPSRPQTGTSVTTAGSRTCTCLKPFPSAAPMPFRLAQALEQHLAKPGLYPRCAPLCGAVGPRSRRGSLEPPYRRCFPDFAF